MQGTVTVVNLIRDTATETDTPVCWVFPACSWRERRGSSGSGTAKDPQRTTHVRIPAGLPAAEKRRHWTLKRGWKLVQGAVPTLTAEEYAHLEKTHLCCTVSAISDNREPLLPHWHVEGS